MEICLCRAMRFTMNLCRIFGIFPISWSHKNRQCCYQVSPFWVAYSLVYCALHVAHYYSIYPEIARPFQQDRSLLLSYVSTITESLTVSYTIVFVLINIYKSRKMVKMLNTCVELKKDDLLCDNALKIYFYLHVAFMIGIIVQCFVVYGAIFALNHLDSFDTNWSYRRILMPIFQNNTFLFYALFGSTCTIFVTHLACYEKKMLTALDYHKVHPLEELDEVKNCRDVLIFKYEICPGPHTTSPLLKDEELIEYFKFLFDKIRDNLDVINQCFDPLCLIHMTVELVNLVFHYYAVIIFFTYDKSTPENSTLNFFNWIYVILHTMGLLLFVMSADHVESTIKRLTRILLEYSTRTTTVRLTQQVRIFLQKLLSQKPITANGIFTINKQMVAPMCANVLMYVLVAVQFRFPKPENSLSSNVTTMAY